MHACGTAAERVGISRRAAFVAPAILLSCAAGAAGCRPAGPARHQIEGRVTFDGKPVPHGRIRFEPDVARGNSGPVGYAAIRNGRYTTATRGSRGALAGPLVVFVTGGPAADPNVEFPTMWFVDYRTTIHLDVTPQTRTFDFDVPTRNSLKEK